MLVRRQRRGGRGAGDRAVASSGSGALLVVRNHDDLEPRAAELSMRGGARRREQESMPDVTSGVRRNGMEIVEITLTRPRSRGLIFLLAPAPAIPLDHLPHAAAHDGEHTYTIHTTATAQ